MYFTADTHFGHNSILRLCARPFEDIAAHDRDLVDAWNATVRPQDDVWHLGDFSHKAGSEDSERIFKKLHGRKHLIVGNHDGPSTLALRWNERPEHAAHFRFHGTRISLCHYAMRTWQSAHAGALMLYGHSHGRLPGNSQSCDVGVDAWDYRPVSLDEVKDRLLLLPPFRDDEERQRPAP